MSQPIKRRKISTVDDIDEDPDIYMLSADILMFIMEYLTTVLDKFHFSVALQKSPAGRAMYFCNKPRELYKHIREKRRKTPYVRPPSLVRAASMTSSWIRDNKTGKERLGFCWECFSTYTRRTYIDITRPDKHPRCLVCIKKYYEPLLMLRRKCRSCKSPLSLTTKLVWPSEPSVGSPRVISLRCTKWLKWRDIMKKIRENDVNVIAVTILFMTAYKMSPDEFGLQQRDSPCIMDLRISTEDGYWDRYIDQWREKHDYAHRFCYHPENSE